MLGVNNFARQGLLKWENIKVMDEAEEVLVNSNRLYSQLSILSRLQGKEKEDCVNILTASINGIKDEKEMYVSMKAGDIVRCFEKSSHRLPLNTFRSVHCKKSVINVKRHGYKMPDVVNGAVSVKSVKRNKKIVKK